MWLALVILPLSAVAAAESSELAPLAAKSLLLDVARAGHRLVTVGDRGHILLSDDEGRSWRQVVVPTRAMLTGVSFVDAQHGWAVGHDNVILTTADGGQSWVQQETSADLETVYLDTHSLKNGAGLVVGAYGKCLRTLDGGKTWTAVAASADEVHFNQISAGPDGSLYLAGESGTLLVSRDDGATWSKLPVPYEGSLFGLLAVDARILVAFGLRGRVFVSLNAGATWSPREVPLPVLIMSGVNLKSGLIILAGVGGNIFVSRDGARTFEPWKPAGFTGGVAALLETTDDALLVVGESGVVRLPIPEARL